MAQTCLFSIIELPEESLKRILPKASTRTLARLVLAYPRAVGRPFMNLLCELLSTPTLEFLREEVNRTELPSFGQIRDAEAELMKIVADEKLARPLCP